MQAIRDAGLKLGVDPLGGAALRYWEPINSVYGLDITIVNPTLDPTFSFMRVDHDGRIRLDCSSPYAMAGLVGFKDRYTVAFANDPDSDRHGIVTPTSGLMNPNHFLAVAIRYLLTNRPEWSTKSAVGKTLVSSSMIDRVLAKLGGNCTKCQWASNGLCPGCSMVRCALGGKRAQVRVSCAAIARFGPPIKTDRSWIFLLRRLRLEQAKIPACTTVN